jgi:hypothetical protein
MAETKITPEEQIAALTAENTDLKAIVADMQEKLEAVSAKAAKAPELVVAKVGKAQYEVTGNAIVPGFGRLTAKELAGNKQAVAKLLEMEGQTILKPL